MSERVDGYWNEESQDRYVYSSHKPFGIRSELSCTNGSHQETRRMRRRTMNGVQITHHEDLFILSNRLYT